MDVTGIKRIQNKNLYERYYFSKLRITNKLEKLKSEGKNIDPNIDEVLGFHGTRNTDPSIIYNSQEGIDRRFTTTGFFGIGSYFAVEAWYSWSPYYVYCTNGEYKVLLCRICPGIMAGKKELDSKTKSILNINPNTGWR